VQKTKKKEKTILLLLLLTPKTLCVFLPNFAIFDIFEKNQFLKKLKYENLRKES
jgi:hypothetical protein